MKFFILILCLLASLKGQAEEEEKGASFSMTAEALYWKAAEGGIAFATLASSGIYPSVGLLPVDLQNAASLRPRFEWDPGIRVDFGYSVNEDFGVDLDYTYFETKAKKKKQVPFFLPFNSSDLLIPLLAINQDASSGTQIENASAHLKLLLNIIDLELGKCFAVSRHFKANPHFGLQAAWIDQTYRIQYGPFVTHSNAVFPQGVEFPSSWIHLRNNYWGLGLRGGINSFWQATHQWGLTANGAFSLLYGFFDLRTKQFLDYSSYLAALAALGSQTTGIFGTNKVKKSYHALRGIADLQLGLFWKTSLRSCDFTINGGWEMHLFLSQNQFMSFSNLRFYNLLRENQGNLATQGFFLSAKWDF